MSAAGGDMDRPVFAPAVAAAMVIAGSLSLLFFVVFAAYAPDLSGQNDGRANALSRSAVGFAALVQFLQAQDVPVLLDRGLSAAEIAKASLIVTTPSFDNRVTDVFAIRNAPPPLLIILQKWIVSPDRQRPGWVSKIGLYKESDIAEGFGVPNYKLVRRAGTSPVNLTGPNGLKMKTGPVESLQTLAGPGLTGYVTDAEGRAVVARGVSRARGDQMVYMLVDPDLANTRGLHDLDTARTAAAIIQSMRANSGPIIFDVQQSGYRRSPNILRLIFEPPLLGATLCALLAALLLGVHAAVRFGPAEEGARIFAFGKQALADNSAALIAMAHREHRIVPRYAAAIRRRVARAVGVPADQRDDTLNALLDRLRRQNDEPLSEIFAEAGAARNKSDALRVARKLYRWREQMIHER